MGSRTASEINGDFGRNWQSFSTCTPCAFNAHVEGVSLVTAAGIKKATRWSRKFDDMCIRLETISQCDGQTDRQTDRNGKTISRSTS